MMADTNETGVGDDEKITTSSQEAVDDDDSSEFISQQDSELHTNGSVGSHDKFTELPELIRDVEGRKGMLSGMPFINMNELAIILRDPSMPSHNIMKEVADKIILKSEESESDDGSVGSTGGGVVGMKGLLDCIFEVTYQQTRSDNSDDDDESFEKIPRAIPCNFCDKVFGSTMTWKTHVLVAHQDPSVLNIRRLPPSDIDRKEKSHAPHRKYSRGTSKSDSEVLDTCHSPRKDIYPKAESLNRDENISSGKRHSSMSREHNEKSGEIPYAKHKAQDELLQKGKSKSCDVTASEEQTEDIRVATIEHKTDQRVVIDPIQISETTSKNIYQDKSDKFVLLPLTGDHDNECQGSEQILEGNQSNKITENIQVKTVEESNMPVESITNENELDEHVVEGRKRKATSPIPESLSSTSSLPSSSYPKRSRKHVAKEHSSHSTQKHNIE